MSGTPAYGTYRQRVKIQQVSSSTDTATGNTKVWTDLITTWAHMKPISVKRQMEYGQLYPDANYEMEIRYNRSWNLKEGNTRVIYPSTDNTQVYVVVQIINEYLLNQKCTFLLNHHNK
jgi:SPP1 family predicted phage head-tail adaptor